MPAEIVVRSRSTANELKLDQSGTNEVGETMEA